MQRKGFTLIEALIALFIAIIATFVIANLLIQGFHALNLNNSEAATIQKAQKIIAQLTLELRQANEGEQGNYPLIIVQPQKIAFYSDVNQDGKTEEVIYYLSGQSLIKEVIPPTNSQPPQYLSQNAKTETLATDIVNGATPIFSYYDSDGNLLSDPADSLNEIRLIRVTLIVNSAPAKFKNYTLKTFIELRNLKDNL